MMMTPSPRRRRRRRTLRTQSSAIQPLHAAAGRCQVLSVRQSLRRTPGLPVSMRGCCQPAWCCHAYRVSPTAACSVKPRSPCPHAGRGDGEDPVGRTPRVQSHPSVATSGRMVITNLIDLLACVREPKYGMACSKFAHLRVGNSTRRLSVAHMAPSGRSRRKHRKRGVAAGNALGTTR
jgi:hypothetical protein